MQTDSRLGHLVPRQLKKQWFGAAYTRVTKYAWPRVSKAEVSTVTGHPEKDGSFIGLPALLSFV